MCLIDQSKTKVAKKDIVVYVVRKVEKNGTLRSPYYGKPWELFHYESDTSWHTKCSLINQDLGYHSFTLKATARKFMALQSGLVLVKATIPAGSEYRSGTIFITCIPASPGRVSQKLVLNEIIEENPA